MKYLVIFHLPTATALEDEDQQLRSAKQMQSLQQAVSHCNKEFHPNILTIL